MTATNHALTGASIGLIIGEPLLAIPIAFLSHFICDIIPHFGGGMGKDGIKSKRFKIMLAVDALLCVVLVGVIFGTRPHHWLLACICAFVATSPDLLWINMFVRLNKGKPWKPNLFENFAGVIQWFQRPIGAVVEVAWAIGAVVVLSIVAVR